MRSRSAATRPAVAGLAAVTVWLLAGCGLADNVPDVDLSRLTEDVQEGVDQARSTLEDAESTIDDASGLSADARAEVEQAVQTASGALDEALAAVEAAAQSAGPDADAAFRYLENSNQHRYFYYNLPYSFFILTKTNIPEQFT